MKGIYGLALGLNSVEGREAKHIVISKYCHNTAYMHTVGSRFSFRSLLHLFGCPPMVILVLRSILTVLQQCTPKRVHSKDPGYCVCGLQKEVTVDWCRFCCHER